MSSQEPLYVIDFVDYEVVVYGDWDEETTRLFIDLLIERAKAFSADPGVGGVD